MANNENKKGNLFIVYRDSLLATGLESVLRARGVCAVQIDLRQGDAWGKLEGALQPGDVVIVDRRDSHVHPSLSIMRLFMNNADINIIGLDPCDNGLDLYRRQAGQVTQPEELVAFIDRCWAAGKGRLKRGGD